MLRWPIIMQNQKWNYSIVVYQFFFFGTIILCLPIWFIVNAFYEKLIDQIKSNTLYIEFLSLWLLYISPSDINPFDDAYTYIILFSIILSIIVTGISRISKYYYGEFWYCVCTCSYLVMCKPYYKYSYCKFPQTIVQIGWFIPLIFSILLILLFSR